MPAQTARNVLTIIQARMGSTRLPGKVLLPLGGEPTLAQIASRVRLSERSGKIVIATSTKKEDDPIEILCRALGFSCFRGDEQDVLDRYYQCALVYSADVVVRVTADCPLLSPQLLDLAVSAFFSHDNLDYFEYQKVPRGITAEVLSMAGLSAAWKDGATKFDREHVTPFLFNRTNRFQVSMPEIPYKALQRPDLRLTLDTSDDYIVISEVYKRFGTLIHEVPIEEIIDVVDSDAYLKKLALESTT